MIKKKDGKESYIEDVFYVPDMKCNLHSLGQLPKKEYQMLKVYDQQKKMVLKAPLFNNRTFKVGIQVMEHRCLSVASSNEEWLWYHRLSHLNFKDLSKMHELAQGVLKLKFLSEKCKECLECKQSRSSFSKFVSVKSK